MLFVAAASHPDGFDKEAALSLSRIVNTHSRLPKQQSLLKPEVTNLVDAIQNAHCMHGPPDRMTREIY